MSVVGKPAAERAPRATLELERIREDFPILARRVHGKRLVYLDSAASAQKPRAVIDAVSRAYAEIYSNVHRGLHYLAEKATEEYESARGKVQRLLNAADEREVVFVRGTTEAINLVAQSFVRPGLGSGDEILITAMEHHSNIVPWQMVCEQTGARLRVAPINDRGELLLEEFESLLTERTRLVAMVHVSNALGTVNPVAEMIAMAHRVGAPVLVDGAQAVPHLPVDVRQLDCEFYAFSGHKLFGPSGIGVLYGKRDLLEAMPPYQGGGEMIRSVTFARTEYNVPPARFEAGTPNIVGAIGLGAAVDYLAGIDFEAVAAHEEALLSATTERLSQLPWIRIIGTATDKAALVSFVVEGVHAHDVGTVLDQEGVAVRAGHHCAQPVMERFGVPATARASFAFYNTLDEVERLAAGIRKVREIFG